jgi:hypothetical protein
MFLTLKLVLFHASIYDGQISLSNINLLYRFIMIPHLNPSMDFTSFNPMGFTPFNLPKGERKKLPSPQRGEG